MSRSYKKHAWVTDGGTPGTKFAKRMANKKVRRTKNIPNGSSYKQVYETYDIRDYKYFWTWKDAKKSWENSENDYIKRHYPTLKEFYRYWVTCVKAK